MAIGVSCSVLFFNLFLKFLPDDISPKLGKYSVDDRRIAAKLAARGVAQQ